MPRLQRKSFSTPDEVRTFAHGHIDVIQLDEIALARFALQPGWRWSQDVAPVAALAGPGEVLVSGTTRELLDGSGLKLEPRGEHELKGLSGPRAIFALRR